MPDDAIGCGSHRAEGVVVPRFIISFGAHAMDHIPETDMDSAADAAHAVVQEIIDAGEYVLAGAVEEGSCSIVAVDKTVADGPDPWEISGVTIVEVASRDDALAWAAKIAIACRCAQEVRAIGPDPLVDAMVLSAQS